MGTKRVDAYQLVTDKILEIIEQGVLPWEQGWISSLYSNLVSGKQYRGLNQFLLNGYVTPFFLTAKQCKDLKGTLKSDAKKNLVIYWTMFESKQKDKTMIPFLKYYYVYNIEDCVGIKHKSLIDWEKRKETFVANETAGKIISHYPIKIVPDRSECFYSPVADHIGIPDEHQFVTSDDYYGAMSHEMVHSTGHESRLDRDLKSYRMDKESYSKEELVAEMGASFLCSMCGIDKTASSASYIKGWASAIKGDKKLIISAASQARKAVDYIMKFQLEATFGQLCLVLD